MQLHRIRNSARAIAVLLASACMLARGQTEARFAGRPFVRVARANTADPTFGFVQGFGRSQVVGGEVVFPVLGNGFRCVGLARGRGGPWSILARAGTTTSTGAALSAFHDGIAEGTVDPRASSFVFAAGGTEADGLYFSDGGTPRLLLPSGTVLPSSGGLVANRLGEPHWVDGKLAVIGWHQAADGVRFRGIYRVIDGGLSTIADTGSPLPGVVGVPDTFSSQLGFDGVVAAFWASRGEFGAVQGMFRHPAPGGTPVEVVSTGGSIPGGGTILGFRSPPVVDRGTVWFFAYDGARVGYLLREDAGVVSVVAKDGDPAPEGGVLAGIGDTGLEASEGRVVFGARTASGTGVYEVEGTSLRPVVPGGGVVAGVRPTSVALVDLAGDTLLLQLAGPGVQPVSLVANLARPQVPVILSGPVGATVPAGATIRLEADVLGDPPLTYLWTGPTGQVIRGTEAVLTIPNAAAAHAGYYSLQVTNEAGSVRGASVLVNVEAPPEILVGPESTAVEAGDSLVLRVIALGGLPLGYAWWKDGQALDAAVGARTAFSVASARASDAGEYHVVVTNAFGTVRSETVRVTVRPSGPNPEYAGRRYQAVVSTGAEVPESAPGTFFAVDGFSAGMARWWLDRWVFVGVDAAYRSLGLFGVEGGKVSRWLGPGAALPGGLGVLDGIRLVASAGLEDAPLFYGNSNGVPVGIFRWENGTIRSVVDVTSAVPGAEGESFRPFYSVAVGVGRDVAFLGETSNRRGAYVNGDGGTRLLLDTKMDLPVLGRGATGLNSLGFDGRIAAILAGNPGLTTQAVLRVSLEGGVTEVARLGDPIPGTEKTIRTFGTVQAGDGVIRYFAFDSGMARLVMEYRDGQSKRLAGPGDVVPGLGTVTAIESSSIPVSGNRVFLTARIRTGTGSANGVFAVTPEGVWEPVLRADKLDGRRVRLFEVVETREDRVAVAVRFEDGGAAYYANTASVGVAAPRLEYDRIPGGGIRVVVPAGAQLEATVDPGGGWVLVPAAGSVDLPSSEGARFFRLRSVTTGSPGASTRP